MSPTFCTCRIGCHLQKFLLTMRPHTHTDRHTLTHTLNLNWKCQRALFLGAACVKFWRNLSFNFVFNFLMNPHMCVCLCVCAWIVVIIFCIYFYRSLSHYLFALRIRIIFCVRLLIWPNFSDSWERSRQILWMANSAVCAGLSLTQKQRSDEQAEQAM